MPSSYSVDTSAILNPWRLHYPPDVFPSLWRRLEEAADHGVIVASEEVLQELAKKDDEVWDWARERPAMFIQVDEAVQQAVRGILNRFPRLVDSRRGRSGADPFVIGLARTRNIAVVTYETPSGNLEKPRIPDVCHALGVGCLQFVEFIRDLGWQL